MSLPQLDKKVFDAEVLNSSVSNSESIEIHFITGYSVQAVWTGAATTGTIKLQQSINGSDWEDVSGSSQAIAGAGSFMWNVANVHYRYFRIVAEETAGNDLTMNTWVYAKGI